MTQQTRFASLRGKSRKWMESYLAEYEEGFDDEFDGFDRYEEHKAFDFDDQHAQFDHVFDFGDEDDDVEDQDGRWLHLYDGWGPIVPRQRVARAPARRSSG